MTLSVAYNVDIECVMTIEDGQSLVADGFADSIECWLLECLGYGHGTGLSVMRPSMSRKIRSVFVPK